MSIEAQARASEAEARASDEARGKAEVARRLLDAEDRAGKVTPPRALRSDPSLFYDFSSCPRQLRHTATHRLHCWTSVMGKCVVQGSKDKCKKKTRMHLHITIHY